MIGRVINFESEDAARERGKQDILDILNNKAIINTDKFSQTLYDYRKRQTDLNSEINVIIKNQIENIKNTKESLEECEKNLEGMKENYTDLSNKWNDDAEWNKKMEIFEKILIYKRNLGTILDQIKYFLNLSKEVQKLEELYPDDNNWEYIHLKLIALGELKKSILTKLGEDKNKSDEIKKIFKEFEVFEKFEQKYFTKIYEIILDCLSLSKEKPHLLIKVLKILEKGDKVIETANTGQKFSTIVKEKLVLSINAKFEEKFKNAKDINGIIESSKSTVVDLIRVLDFVVPCFPEHYNIFKIYEENYRKNIEDRIMPFLNDEEKIKESYGILVALLTWLDSYETLLKRAGIEEADYSMLKSRVKYYMPYFMDHLKKILTEYCERVFAKDRVEQQRLDILEKKIKSKKDLLSNFPEDIFAYINKQLEILRPQLSGELFIEFIRIITSTINSFQVEEKTRIITEAAQSLNEDYSNTLSPMFKVVLFINNYFKCLQYSNETKQYCIDKIEVEEIRNRIENIFVNELNKGLSSSISDFFEVLNRYLFVEIEAELIPSFFTEKWTQESLLESAVMTLEDYFKEIKSTLLSPLHANKITKQSLEHLMNLYVDMLIYSVQKAFNACKDFKSDWINVIMMKRKKIETGADGAKKSKTEKNAIKEQQSLNTKVLSDHKMIAAKIQKEREYMWQQLKQNYSTGLGKAFTAWIEKVFDILIGLLTKPNCDIEGIFLELYEIFKEKGVYVLEVSSYIRQDINGDQKKLNMIRYNEIIKSLGKK